MSREIPVQVRLAGQKETVTAYLSFDRISDATVGIKQLSRTGTNNGTATLQRTSTVAITISGEFDSLVTMRFEGDQSGQEAASALLKQKRFQLSSRMEGGQHVIEIGG